MIDVDARKQRPSPFAKEWIVVGPQHRQLLRHGDVAIFAIRQNAPRAGVGRTVDGASGWQIVQLRKTAHQPIPIDASGQSNFTRRKAGLVQRVAESFPPHSASSNETARRSHRQTLRTRARENSFAASAPTARAIGPHPHKLTQVANAVDANHRDIGRSQRGNNLFPDETNDPIRPRRECVLPSSAPAIRRDRTKFQSERVRAKSCTPCRIENRSATDSCSASAIFFVVTSATASRPLAKNRFDRSLNKYGRTIFESRPAQRAKHVSSQLAADSALDGP